MKIIFLTMILYVMAMLDVKPNQFTLPTESRIDIFIKKLCSHCENTLAAIQTIQHAFDIPIQTIDCTNNLTFANQYNIYEYPTIQYFHNNISLTYDFNQFQLSDFIDFLTQNQKRLLTTYDYPEIQKYKFTLIFNREDLIPSNISINNQNIKIMINQNQQKQFAFYHEGQEILNISLENIQNKIQQLQNTQWRELTKSLARDLFSNKINFIALFNSQQIDIGNVTYTKIYCHQQPSCISLQNWINVNETNPFLALVRWDTNLTESKVNLLVQPDNKQKINDFFQKINEQPIYEISEIKDDVHQNVIELSTINYNSFVNDPTQDVVVFFYSDKCLHSRALNQTIQRMGKNKKRIGSVRFTMIDVSKNKLKVDLKQIPMLGIYSKKNKELVMYEGLMIEHDIWDFLEKLLQVKKNRREMDL